MERPVLLHYSTVFDAELVNVLCYIDSAGGGKCLNVAVLCYSESKQGRQEARQEGGNQERNGEERDTKEKERVKYCVLLSTREESFSP